MRRQVNWTAFICSVGWILARVELILKRLTMQKLDKTLKSDFQTSIEAGLQARVVGQERAIKYVSRRLAQWEAGLSPSGKPISNILMLGPTGSGKTHFVESLSEVLFDTKSFVVKVDCTEYQHTHEVAKLMGSPPGYLGHRESKPKFNLEAISTKTKEGSFWEAPREIALVLFDEIEKAADSLWQLLLGILDKGILSLGDNTTVDF